MKIGELASASGVSVRSLRYYEEQGLLASSRSAGGQRVFDDEAAERVRWIQQLYAAGLSSADLIELMPCLHTGRTTPAMIARLVREQHRIEEQIAALSATRDRLVGVVVESRARLEPTVG